MSASTGRWPWRQLALPFVHQPQFTAAGFLAAASNAEALAWLARTEDWPQGRLALWGEEGCGKTHLLHLWAERTGAAVLAGAALPDLPPAGRPLAVDDADTAPERALLHLLNATAEARHPVLLAGRAAPARWNAALPDLASRLRAVTAVPIHPPEETLLRALLASLLAERQLAVSPPVQDWLLLRLPRTPAAMREAAARLDHIGLAAGHKIGHAIAASAVADMPRAAEPAIPNHEDFTAGEAPASTAPPRLL